MTLYVWMYTFMHPPPFITLHKYKSNKKIELVSMNNWQISIKLHIQNTIVFTLHLSWFITLLFSCVSVHHLWEVQLLSTALSRRTAAERTLHHLKKKTAIVFVFGPGCRRTSTCYHYLDYKSGHNINSTPPRELEPKSVSRGREMESKEQENWGDSEK